MSTTVEPDRRAAWEGLIRTVGYLLQVSEQELQDSQGLPLGWYDVLIQLYGASDRRLRMQALADRTVLSRSGLTRLVDRMERAGLVQREASKEDRRGSYAVLTEEGRRVFFRARPVHRRGIHEHFTRHLDDADIQALLTVFAKVRAANQLPDIAGKRGG